jgi:hypothetical protein
MGVVAAVVDYLVVVVVVPQKVIKTVSGFSFYSM